MLIKLGVFLVLLTSVLSNNLDIKIKKSIVTGAKYSDTITAYIGIQYAQPPIGDLRFEAPVKPEYTYVLNNNSKEAVICPQVSITSSTPLFLGEEDCLYLSVYVPSGPKKNAKHPVMIYIHGGAFQWGTGTINKPDYLLRNQNVILVNLNYRLGALGFLTAGKTSSKIYANNGMKDQRMAIQWVYDNIEHFGGDKEKITLFGESAGAASTHLHLFEATAKKRGVFHAAIIQSGAALCQWAVRSFEQMAQLTAEYSRLLGCPTLPTNEMVECLKEKSLDILMNTFFNLNVFDLDPLVLLSPTIEPEHEDAFLLDYPKNLLQDRKFYDVPIMQGITTEEGCFRAALFAGNKEALQKLDQHFVELYPVTTNSYQQLTREDIEEIRTYYFKNGALDQDNYRSLIKMYTDVYFLCTDDSVHQHRKFSTHHIYSYIFGYKGTLGFDKILAKNATINQGVCHQDELLYIFPLEFLWKHFENIEKEFSENDKRMSVFLTKLWIHFATYRNFDNFVDPDGLAINWSPVKSQKNEYFLIDNTFSYGMKNNYFEKSKQFWDGLKKKSLQGHRIQRNEL